KRSAHNPVPAFWRSGAYRDVRCRGLLDFWGHRSGCGALYPVVATNTGRGGGTVLTLYSYWRSSAAYRVRIALNLKGLAYRQVPVHLLKNGGEQHGEAYRTLN